MPVTTYRQWTIHYQDEDELKTLLQEIFKERTYYVDLPSPRPTIIDAGAHIGLPTLYFHSLYPQAHFILFEPDPLNLELLRTNLEANQITNYELIPKALIGNKDRHTLYSNHHWTVFSSLLAGGWTGEEAGEPIEIETTPLLPYLQQHVDLLKMDIEGMETEVLLAAQDGLKSVDSLVLEFHRTAKQSEEHLLKTLKNYFSEINVTVDPRHERNHHNQLLFIEAHK